MSDGPDKAELPNGRLMFFQLTHRFRLSDMCVRLCVCEREGERLSKEQ